MSSAMKKVMILIDPNSSEQIAYQRATTMNELNDGNVSLHLFISGEMETLMTTERSFDCIQTLDWLENLVAPLKDKNIPFTVDICWSVDWQTSVINAAKKYDVDRIIMSDYATKGGETTLSALKWALLRTSPCPVLIVHPDSQMKRKTVLAALRTQTSNVQYVELNKKIIDVSWKMNETYGADIHVVNSYDDPEDYPSPGTILNNVNIPSENLHIEEGKPGKIIATIADKIDADIVVIGSLARKGLAAAMKGNTAEAIIKELKCDVLVLN
jgi:universal stress protein E